ncbi:MAG: ComEC/Rec2 family competence protein [Aquificaceae bacterium]
MKSLLLFLLILPFSFFRAHDPYTEDENLGRGYVVFESNGIPEQKGSYIEIRGEVVGGEFPEIYGKRALLKIYGAESLEFRTVGLEASVKVRKGKVFLSASYGMLKAIYPKKKSIRDGFIEKAEQRIQDKEVSSLFLAYIFGEEQDVLPLRVQSSFGLTGLTHLLVVSGSHVTLIALMLNKIAPHRYGILLSLLGITFYVLLFVPYEPPVLRAYVMLFFALLVKLFYRRPDLLGLLFLSGCLILSVYPHYVKSYSFWLSFFATLYLILSVRNTEGIKRFFNTRFKVKAWYYLFLSFWSSLFAFLGTAPLVASFSLVAPVSIIATPVVAVLFVPFTAYSLLEVVSSFNLPTFPVEALGKLIIKLVDVFSSLEFTLRSFISFEKAMFVETLGAFTLYFLKDWWKLITLGILSLMLF